MMMLLALAAAALQDARLPSPEGARWEVLDTGSVGQIAIDPQSLKWTGRRVRLSARLRLAEVQGGVRTAVIQYVYDCNARTFRPEITEVYDDAGNFLASEDTPAESLTDSPITASSPNDVVLKRVCTAG